MAWLKNRALDELTTAINLGETKKALSLIKPELPLDAVAQGQHSSPLFAAIEAANTAIVEALLAAGASVTLPNEMGETPLHAAASKGDDGAAALRMGLVWFLVGLTHQFCLRVRR